MFKYKFFLTYIVALFSLPFSVQALPKHCRILKNGRLYCKLRSKRKRIFSRKYFSFSPKKLKPYKRALSVGAPWHGMLYRGVKMPLQGIGYVVVNRTIKRRRFYALPKLIELIRYAAKSVNQMFPNSILTVADLSQKNGGFVFGHKSHQSGRDVDIGFYVIDNSKRYRVFTSFFIPFDRYARGKGKYSNMLFDLERNWKLIESLLTYKKISVIRIFVSQELKDLLIEYAKSAGKNKHIINRVNTVLKDFPHHEDHFHVRIACPKKQPFCY